MKLETAQEAIMALNSAFSEQRSLAFSKHLWASNSISVLFQEFHSFFFNQVLEQLYLYNQC